MENLTDYREVAYLDNAATTPMPEMVLEAIENYYRYEKVNVHRGMYRLAGDVTRKYEDVRQQVAEFIGAQNVREVIFTNGATDALNLVAFGYGRHHLKNGDEIIVTVMEHHSNLVPWQQVAQETGVKIKVVGITADGKLDEQQLFDLITPKTIVVALTMMSNVLGNRVAVEKIARKVHQQGGVLVVDAAQAIVHIPIDVHQMDIDFLAFSGHKMFGPTGIGVLFGKEALLNQMTPVRFGGEMVDQVNLDHATFQPIPLKLEAGTPNVAGVLGLGAAVQFIQSVGFKQIQNQEQQIMQRLLNGLEEMNDVQIYGTLNPSERFGVVSFNVGNFHAHDVATILDADDVAVRAGHLCAEPLMKALGVQSVVRASITFETSVKDVDRLLSAVEKVGDILS